MLQAASLFNQLLQHFPRTEFASLVKNHLAERAAKGFTCWTQFVALSYANEHRPAALFEDLFYTSLNRFREQQGMGARKAKFRFKNKLLSLDSTTISLCLELFPWAKFRRAKGGVKAHVLLDHDDYLPSYVLITEAKQSDVRAIAGTQCRFDCGHGSRLQRLCAVRQVDRTGRVLRYPAQGERRLRGAGNGRGTPA